MINNVYKTNECDNKFIDSKRVVTSCDSNIHLFPVEKDDDLIGKKRVF